MARKQLVAGLATGVLVGALSFGALGASAHPGMSDLTDEERADKVSQMQEHRSERLQEKVDSGDITAEQKSQIEQWTDEKFTELESVHEDMPTREEMQAMSDDEREALKQERMAMMEEQKAEAEAFFESIGIDPETIGKGGGHRGHHGHGMGGEGPQSDESSAPVENTSQS